MSNTRDILEELQALSASVYKLLEANNEYEASLFLIATKDVTGEDATNEAIEALRFVKEEIYFEK